MSRKKRKGPLSCINGVKGAISLFMAILMTPFLTIALLLVEVGRYNNAVSMLDEALGVSSISTLASYDDYLQQRWGLMALDQKNDYKVSFEKYLDTNGKIMGNTIDVEDLGVSGMYDVADPDVLMYQILEYSKLNAPTTLVTEFLNVSDLIAKLEKLTNLTNIVELITNGVGAIDAGITLAESEEKLKESANKLDGYCTDYENKYVAFESATNTLIANLQKKRSLEAEKSTLVGEKSTLVGEKSTLSSQLTTLTNELNSLEIDLQQLQAANKSEQEIDAKQAEIDAKQGEIDAKQGEIDDKQGEIDAVTLTINSNRTSAETAKTEYADIFSKITAEMTEYRTQMKSCEKAMLEIGNYVAQAASNIGKEATNLAEKKKDLEAAKKSLEEMEKNGFSKDDTSYAAGLDYKVALENEVAKLETSFSIYDASAKGLKEMHDSMKTTADSYSDAAFGEKIEYFETLRQKINAFNVNNVSASSATITRDSYKNVYLDGYVSEADLDKILKEQEERTVKGTLKSLLDGLTTIYKELMGLSIFFEANLDSRLDVKYYDDNFGGLPFNEFEDGSSNSDGSPYAIIKSIGDICSSVISFKSNLATLKFVKALKDLSALGKSVISLFENLAAFVITIIKNIIDLLSYERWELVTYATYNLPCRTDYSSTGKISHSTMTGYSIPKEAFPEERTIHQNIPVFGELATLIKQIVDIIGGEPGKDITFTGAELEYILFGSTNEVSNQLYVFCVHYLFRLLLCIPSVLGNAEVQGLAASATLGYPVVIALYIFLEPLVQTILLANGADQPLIPAKVYLSPSGLPELIEEVVSFCNFTDDEEDAFSDKMVSAFTTTKDDYDYQKTLAEYKKRKTEDKDKKGGTEFLEFSYREYCLFLMLITVSNDQIIGRLSNLIQMETLHYYNNKYKDTDPDFKFDLNKSYSYICVWAEAKVAQMMPSLSRESSRYNSMFSVKRTIYRGY